MQNKNTTQAIQHKINKKHGRICVIKNKFRSLCQRIGKIFMFDNNDTISTNYNKRRHVSSLLV